MEMKNIHVEQLAPVLVSLGEVKHPMLAFNIAMMQQKVTPLIEALQKARVPLEGYTEYQRSRIALCEVHAEKDENGKAMKEHVQGSNGMQENYKMADLEVFAVEAKKLEAQYLGIIQQEATRQKSVIELLTSPSELEFPHKIKYSWCKDHLTGNNLALLMACDVLDLDETPDGTPVIQGTPAVAIAAVKDLEE